MSNQDDMEFISVNQYDDDGEMGGNVNISNYKNGSGNDDDTVGGFSFLKFSNHPTTLCFHVLFKAAALFLYIFGNWVTTSFVLTFVLCIILLAFDFWTVKNVSGRLLVGLRWWSYVKDDGSNEWMFESLEDMAEISAFDSRIFWGTLYATPIVWSLLFIIGILRLKFEYLPIVAAAIAMSGANVIGYYKCSNDAKDKMQSFMQQGIRSTTAAALSDSSVMNWVMSTIINTNSSNNSGNSV